MNKSVVNVIYRYDGCCGFRCLDRRCVITTPVADSIAAVTIELRVEIALARSGPNLLCGENVSSAIIDTRLSLTSFEIRNPVLQLTDRHIPSGDFQCLAADLAVAGAELVSLQGI